MRKETAFIVKARKPKVAKFGDFVINDVNYNDNTAVANFGNDSYTVVDVSAIIPKLREFSSRTKRYYVRLS